MTDTRADLNGRKIKRAFLLDAERLGANGNVMHYHSHFTTHHTLFHHELEEKKNLENQPHDFYQTFISFHFHSQSKRAWTSFKWNACYVNAAVTFFINNMNHFKDEKEK